MQKAGIDGVPLAHRMRNLLYGDTSRRSSQLEIKEAKQFVGCNVALTYLDRRGLEVRELAQVFQVAFVPMYGPCLLTTIGEIRIDRVVTCEAVRDISAAA